MIDARASWVPAVVFGALAALYTYGFVTWGPPLDRARSEVAGTFILVFLWGLVATFTTIAVVAFLKKR